MKVVTSLRVLLVCAGLGATGTAAIAQDDAPSYSMEDVKACSVDAMRLCKRNMPSVKAIENCMRAHFDKLSPRCQARFR